MALNAVTSAAAATTSTQGGFDITSVIFPLLLVFLVFMMWNNGRKRKKADAELRSSLGAGANIILHSGITGTIVSLDDVSAIIETTPGTRLRVVPGAIRGIDTTLAQPETPAEDAGDSTDNK